jgi:hypothetical protein
MCIQEIVGSNLGWDSSNPDFDISWFYTVLAGSDRFLPNEQNPTYVFQPSFLAVFLMCVCRTSCLMLLL